jgi:hypothetical protein
MSTGPDYMSKLASATPWELGLYLRTLDSEHLLYREGTIEYRKDETGVPSAIQGLPHLL